jgi:PAS domain S-box-containing protein
MKKDKSPSTDQSELRSRAEERLRVKAPSSAAASSEEDAQRLVHELQVHQIELDLQNEELRQAREGLEAALERYTDLYEFAPVGYFTVDHLWNIHEANLTGAALLGAKRTSLLGRNFGRFLSLDTRGAFHDFLRRASAKRTKQVCEVQLDRQETGPRFLHMEGEAIEPDQGQEGHYRMAVMDVTERKRGEEALRLLAAIVESSDDGIIGMTLEGVITSWNRGAESVYGYSTQEMVGQVESRLAPPERSDEINLLLGKVGQGRQVTHFETERIAKDGRRLSMSLTLSPTRNIRGEIVGASTIARDITDRKQAEKEREGLIGQCQEAIGGHGQGQASQRPAAHLRHLQEDT